MLINNEYFQRFVLSRPGKLGTGVYRMTPEEALTETQLKVFNLANSGYHADSIGRRLGRATKTIEDIALKIRRKGFKCEL